MEEANARNELATVPDAGGLGASSRAARSGFGV